MDKTLDLDELERVAKRATQARRYRVGPKVYARGHGVPLLTVNDLGPSLGQQDEDATYTATFDPPTILSLISAARPAEISTPDMPGQFEGDIWFGDPVKRNLGTHRWENGEWVLLPSELESVLELLAVRTAQRDTALSAARPAVVSDEVVDCYCGGFGPRGSVEHREGCPERDEDRRQRAALALLPGGVPDREAIARVIDPDSWSRAGALAQREEIPACESHYTQASLAKADAIIAMLSASPEVK